MKIPLIYNIRSVRRRPVSTLATALGMGLVVLVFIAMMALSRGFRAAIVETGSRENVLVVRSGADNELMSGLSRSTAQTIISMPFVAKGPEGRPLASPEIYVLVSLERLAEGDALVVARGVSPQAFEVRKDVKVIAGRMFNPGAPEILVGKSIVGRFAGTEIGETINFASRDWTVVGHFAAEGSAFESEIWGENEQFMPAFRGEVFQSVTFRMYDPADFESIKQTLESDPRLTVSAQREYNFYANQSVLLTQVLSFAAIFIAGIMAIGAVFGAVNTMYAAVSARAPEIAVLLTLGFRPLSVLSSFLMEALVIALIGGMLGCLFALPLNGIMTSTTNWASMSEVAFAFRVTPDLLLRGVIFALAMGLIGGFLPARRAARQPIVQAARRP
ncbi:MAG: ABC transporter permease [Gemmatimonadota bacterium]|nr:MAG: ABC transporter permease [Gemmatimonadota bacterium]